MLSASTITEWLDSPRPLTPAEVEAVNATLREVPYFIPAHYMDAAEQHRRNSSPSPLQAMMQLYLGEWTLFHHILHTANAPEETRQQIRLTDWSEPDAAAEEEETAEAEEAQPVEAEPLPEEEAEPKYGEEAENGFHPDHDGLEDAILHTHEVENDGIVMPEEPVAEAEEGTVPEEEAESEDAPEYVSAYPYYEEAEEEMPDEVLPAGEEIIEIKDDEPEAPPTPQPEVSPQAGAVAQEPVIQPLYTEDYFRYEGVKLEVPHEPTSRNRDVPKAVPSGADLMVMRSFADWLLHFRAKKEEAREEAEGRRALKAHWQKEKLAAALEEEDDEIPEAVFEMAVSSITQEGPLVSESMAAVYAKQGKWDKAIEVYRRLQSVNPAKSAYFAAKIAAAEQQKSTWSS